MLQVPELEIGDVVLQPLFRRLRVAGDSIRLTEQESYLIEALALCADTMVTHRMLRSVLQLQSRCAIASNTVESHIARLRRKLGNSQSVEIHSIRKQGYKLSVS